MKNEKKSPDQAWSFLIVFVLFAGAIILGSLGWKEYLKETDPTLSWTDIAYLLLTLFTVNASFSLPDVPLFLDLARFFAPAALAGTIILVAMSFFRSFFSSLRIRVFYRSHAVFYGCNGRSLLLASDIRKTRKVVFLPSPGDQTPLEDAEGIRAVALGRSFSHRASFVRSSLLRSKYVFIMSGTDTETQAVARETEEYLSSRQRRSQPTVFVEYSDGLSLRIAREQDEGRIGKQTAAKKRVELQPFNLELLLAREIIDRYMPANFARPFHAAIFGFDRIGQTLAFEAAQMFHFPDLRKPRLTVIDRDVQNKWQIFISRHPDILETADIELADFGEWKQKIENDLPSLALLPLNDASLALDTARVLRQLQVRERGSPMTICIVPPIGNSEGFPDASCSADFLEAQKIDLIDPEAFLKGTDIIDRRESCDALAKGIHYSWMAKPGQPWQREKLDEEWDILSDITRDSNRYAARHFPVKLLYLGWALVPEKSVSVGCEFKFSEIPAGEAEILGRMEHNRWVAEKYLAGYLPTSCADPDEYRIQKKTFHLHVNLVPWESLSRGDQLKDMNILLYATEIAGAAGFKLVKL